MFSQRRCRGSSGSFVNDSGRRGMRISPREPYPPLVISAAPGEAVTELRPDHIRLRRKLVLFAKRERAIVPATPPAMPDCLDRADKILARLGTGAGINLIEPTTGNNLRQMSSHRAARNLRLI